MMVIMPSPVFSLAPPVFTGQRALDYPAGHWEGEKGGLISAEPDKLRKDGSVAGMF